MAEVSSAVSRVLIVDDELDIRDAYRQSFIRSNVSDDLAAFRRVRQRLFAQPAPSDATDRARPSASFNLAFCEGAESAVCAVGEALGCGQPFAVVFLDMRMPPGPDGVWAATRIREMDPAIEIVICTAYSDVDPANFGRLIPPEDKLSYLQKPFACQEIRQMAISLTSKWHAASQVARLANFDPLTGLANRDHCRRLIANATTAARDSGHALAVVYLDLDNFKRVNDTLGHAAGDELLCLVASRLQRSLRRDDRADSASAPYFGRADAARLAGDEFIVLLRDITNREDVKRVVDSLITELERPAPFAHHTLTVSPSIGIAVYPTDGEDVDSLVRNSELAMYDAKRRNRGTYVFYDSSMSTFATRRNAIEDQLQGALERGEFVLHYQPQFDVQSGSISGMEALLRWNNAKLGSVPPLDFIPVAEETGLILTIGEWVLRQACTQAKVWAQEAPPHLRMAVNVSGRQFALRTFPALVASIISETGIDAALLELEITESVVMNDETWAEEALIQLKNLGLSIAIDDFGTGYSSFGRLRRFAVDRLKIDRSFITDINDSRDDRAIAAAIIEMSHTMGIKVTAEGVETFAQLMFLQEHACQEAQGFLFSRPLTSVDAQSLLRRAAHTANDTRTQRLRALIE